MAARSIPCSSGAAEDPQATAWGEYLAEGTVAPMYMLRRGPWKYIHCPTDPEQLFNLVDDPNELNNLAESHPIAKKFHAEVVAKFDIPRINEAVLESQHARLMMFEALKSGSAFPLGFPAAARCLRAIYPQPHERHRPRPAITLSHVPRISKDKKR